MILEGAGFRPTGRDHGRSPTDLLVQARCSGRVPSSPPCSDLPPATVRWWPHVTSRMTEQAAIFTAGPPVVKESTGEDISRRDIGGPGVALASGLIHEVVEDDAAALALVRRYLSYFPSERMVLSPVDAPDGDDQGCAPGAGAARDHSPRQPQGYDMRRVLDVIFDRRTG